MADTTTAHAAAIHGHIAARIDRLPLTRVQWHLAILVEITWGFIIFDTDGIGARLYPFVWRPDHIIDVYQYAVIQALQVGARHSAGRLSDELGRRPVRPPPGYPARHSARRHLHLAIRLRHQLLGDGGAVGAQHAGRRRYRGDALGVSVRDDLAAGAQQGAAGLARRHRTGRGQRQPAGVLADTGPVAGVPLDQRDHRDRRAAALALLEAAGIAALAGGAWPARGSRRAMEEYERQVEHTTAIRCRRQEPETPRGHGGKGRLEGTVHQPAVPPTHLGADRLLAGRVRRPDLRRRRVPRGLHGGPRRHRRTSCS